MSKTEERVIQLVAEQLGLNVATITPDAVFSELGTDSLDEVELAMALEDEFDIELPDDELVTVKTVAETVAIVNKYLQARHLTT